MELFILLMVSKIFIEEENKLQSWCDVLIAEQNAAVSSEIKLLLFDCLIVFKLLYECKFENGELGGMGREVRLWGGFDNAFSKKQ